MRLGEIVAEAEFFYAEVVGGGEAEGDDFIFENGGFAGLVGEFDERRGVALGLEEQGERGLGAEAEFILPGEMKRGRAGGGEHG